MMIAAPMAGVGRGDLRARRLLMRLLRGALLLLTRLRCLGARLRGLSPGLRGALGLGLTRGGLRALLCGMRLRLTGCGLGSRPLGSLRLGGMGSAGGSLRTDLLCTLLAGRSLSRTRLRLLRALLGRRRLMRARLSLARLRRTLGSLSAETRLRRPSLRCIVRLLALGRLLLPLMSRGSRLDSALLGDTLRLRTPLLLVLRPLLL